MKHVKVVLPDVIHDRAVGSSLHTMPTIPLPNWRINYDGLMQLKVIKKKFQVELSLSVIILVWKNHLIVL